MNKLVAIGALALAFLPACSPQASEPASAPPAAETPAAAPLMNDMPMPATTPTAGPVTATGKIIGLDAASGSVTLEHEAIPAVKWDAMTMSFTVADPAALKDLKVGDTVVFDLKSVDEPTQISRIAKQ